MQTDILWLSGHTADLQAVYRRWFQPFLRYSVFSRRRYRRTGANLHRIL